MEREGDEFIFAVAKRDNNAKPSTFQKLTDLLKCKCHCESY